MFMPKSRKSHPRLFTVTHYGPRIPFYGYGDDERFARLVRSTWFQIPYGHRRKMIEFWRSSQSRAAPYWNPTFSLLVDWARRTPGMLGFCTGHGRELRFYAPAVDKMPDEVVRTLIAHEIGHVFVLANGSASDMDEESEEIEVRFLNDDWWGFDEAGIDEWMQAEGQTIDEDAATAAALEPVTRGR